MEDDAVASSVDVSGGYSCSPSNSVLHAGAVSQSSSLLSVVGSYQYIYQYMVRSRPARFNAALLLL